MKRMLVFLAGVLIAAPAFAAEVETVGTSCWTGTTNVIATGPKDFAMTWEAIGTFTNDPDPAENCYFKCVGSSETIGGETKASPSWCHCTFADGSIALSRATPNADGTSDAVYVAGTGRHEGMSGTWHGEVAVVVGQPPAGTLSGCRRLTGTKVLK